MMVDKNKKIADNTHNLEMKEFIKPVSLVK